MLTFKIKIKEEILMRGNLTQMSMILSMKIQLFQPILTPIPDQITLMPTTEVLTGNGILSKILKIAVMTKTLMKKKLNEH